MYLMSCRDISHLMIIKLGCFFVWERVQCYRSMLPAEAGKRWHSTFCMLHARCLSKGDPVPGSGEQGYTQLRGADIERFSSIQYTIFRSERCTGETKNAR